MDMLSGHVHRRRGIAMIYAVIAMVCLCAFVSLAVDLGRVQVAKTELMRAADAAARAAATELSKGSNLTTIQNAAVNIANANKCDGSAIALNSATDIEFGTWDPDAESFTVLGTYTSANAVRVTARRTNATSNAIPLAYGRVVGRASCDVKASAIAYIPPATPAITGLSKFDAYSGLYIASYNPNSVLLPTMFSGWHSNNGELGSNGTLDLGTSGNLWGDEYVGPSASVTSNGVLHGIKHMQSANIPTPTIPAMTPLTNPSGISRTPTVSGNVVWPGGTYYFTSFTMGDDDSVTFTGVATILMNGNVSIHDRCFLIPYNYKAQNLLWYQAAGTNFTVNNVFGRGGQFIGPNANFTANDDLYFAGTMIFKNIVLDQDAQLYVDETLSTSSVATTNIISVR
jgi:Flp pilus assembly protein TadG